jgi:hypothetical protein
VDVIFTVTWIRKCLNIHQRYRFIYITRVLSVKFFPSFVLPYQSTAYFSGGAWHKTFEIQCHKPYNKLYIAMSLTISSKWWLIQGDDSERAS